MKQRKRGERANENKGTLSKYVRPRAGLAKSLLVSQNIRSINSSNMDEFKRLLSILDDLQCVDIIALQEVWSGMTMPKLQGYKDPLFKIRSGQRGGGVAFYIKNYIKYI